MSLLIHVLSDVQGRLDHLDRALRQLAVLGPADHLVLVGDLVDRGDEDEYDALFAALAAHDLPRITATVGNHEFYNPSSSDESIARFLRRTGEPGVWGRRTITAGQARSGEVTASLEVAVLGTLDGSGTGGHDVHLGEEQIAFAAEFCRGDGVRLVFTHQPLPDTVSGTRRDQSWDEYVNNHAEPDGLREALARPADQPPTVLFTGHTHWSLDRDDFCVWVPVEEGTGFWAVNTGALQNQYGLSSGPGREVITDHDAHSGLRLLLDEHQLTIEAFDFKAEKRVRTAAIALSAR